MQQQQRKAGHSSTLDLTAPATKIATKRANSKLEQLQTYRFVVVSTGATFAMCDPQNIDSKVQILCAET
jgi:hypothetical protein